MKKFLYTFTFLENSDYTRKEIKKYLKDRNENRTLKGVSFVCDKKEITEDTPADSTES